MAGMFSTKGRYALRIMGDLATHQGWVSLGDVAKRQGISRKYLEQVVSLLHRAGFVESLRGKGGGYRLTREPADYTLGSILRAAEGSLAPVSCLDCTNDEICPQIDTCPTVTMWRDLGKVTASYLDSKTLADIVSEMEERGTAEVEARREQSAEKGSSQSPS
jgi:Rrf2 family protein